MSQPKKVKNLLVRWSSGLACSVLLLGCGKGVPAEEPDSDAADVLMDGESSEGDASERRGRSDKPAPDAEPNFEPGMSVDAARSAIPVTAQRIQIEDEALAEPLRQPELYEPCKLKGTEHFVITVAVWNGRAVGLDVEAKPANADLETCLRTQVERIEWHDKVKSLNTVQFNY